MRLVLRLCVVAGVAALVLPGRASAATQTLVVESAPINVTAYEMARGVQLVPSPKVDGYVVGMSADVVDVLGNPVPMQAVMLHHVVFAKIGTPDSTCSTIEDYSGRPSPLQAQRFYAEGEEHFTLGLPDGYGYPNRGFESWGLLYMLMNHHPHTMVVRVRYTIRYVTGEPLTAVKPVWLDVENCRADPVFNVPGTGGRGSPGSRQGDFRMPESGRFVAPGGGLPGRGGLLGAHGPRAGPRFTPGPARGPRSPSRLPSP